MLVAVADRLRDVVRETDDIARIGGDEFAVVLPNVVESEAQMVAERVIAALTDRDAFRLQMQASIGVGWRRNVTGQGRGWEQVAQLLIQPLSTAQFVAELLDKTAVISGTLRPTGQ